MSGRRETIYVSVDIEADGPIPGVYSMLSIGAVAYLPDKETRLYKANLETLPEGRSDPDTMKWWSTKPNAWEIARQNLVSPEVAMKDFVVWLKDLPGTPVFVAYPAGFDFTFVYWYLIRFAGESPFSFSALDMKTLAMAAMGCEYRDATKKNMPKSWFSTKHHSHVALDDAIEQGDLFWSIMKELGWMHRTIGNTDT